MNAFVARSKFFTLLRSFGPAMGIARGWEPLRAGLGGFFGLGICAAYLLSPVVDSGSGLFLIAPLGASAVLLFAVPNSPLAQPWSAVIGNTVSGLVAWGVLLVVKSPPLAIGLSVGGAILAMSLVRAIHPPGGAVALLSALNAHLVLQMGVRFSFVAAGGGTLALVVLAIIWNRCTLRQYPSRQAVTSGPSVTPDGHMERRLGLLPDELSKILVDLREDTNVGVEDLVRLIEAAETAAAAHHLGNLTCAEIMSRDLTTVRRATPLAEVADLFSEHRFSSLPVVEPDGGLAGVILQIDLIRALARANSSASWASVFAGSLPGRESRSPDAGSAMSGTSVSVTPKESVRRLLPILSSGGVDAVPVLDGGTLVGVVTRTDLVSALIHAPSMI